VIYDLTRAKYYRVIVNMTATIEKQTTAGEIYKEAYFNVLKNKDQYTRRLIVGEIDVKDSGDKRAIELFLKEVIDIAEKQMNKSEI
jgi:hypothetical protein